jgi:undecaprenyl-diphosphatase
VDDWLAIWANRAARRTSLTRLAIASLARWLAAAEIALMVRLAIGGRRGTALRMLRAVVAVYLVCDALGWLWPRRRPFASLLEVSRLVEHDGQRSFPSRHVASGLAMAVVGGRAHPRLGVVMSGVAWLLGVTRVAAGLHYPTDVLGGAALGILVGRYGRCA